MVFSVIIFTTNWLWEMKIIYWSHGGRMPENIRHVNQVSIFSWKFLIAVIPVNKQILNIMMSNDYVSLYIGVNQMNILILLNILRSNGSCVTSNYSHSIQNKNKIKCTYGFYRPPSNIQIYGKKLLLNCLDVHVK